MRFLVRLVTTTSKGDVFLSSVKALARAVGADARNPKWTSYGALELDVFTPTRADFELFLSVVGPICHLEFSRYLNEAPKHTSEEESFSEARAYFNSERYWECHEVLEGVWRNKGGDEKPFLQGLILVCAAFVHHQKRQDKVGLAMLERANRQLDFPAVHYHGIDMIHFRPRVTEILSSGKFSVFTI